MEIITGNLVDIFNREIYPAKIYVDRGIINKIERSSEVYDTYITPPLVDAHVHIESSMLTPENFSRMVVANGTVAVVHDPHEIANVLGVEGIEFMLKNSRHALIKCFSGIPSCVPATPFDRAGAKITSKDVQELAESKRFVMLSEMMNVPGVLYGDEEVMKKLEIAHKYKLPIDGHAPYLSGESLKKYINAGISTDHETSDLNEALEKISLGMKIIIREGSAAKNYQELKSLIATHPNELFFCTDDAHPDEIMEVGHIDRFLRMGIADGFDIYSLLKIASFNPISHYNLSVGTLKVGEMADFVRFKDLTSFKVLETYIEGKKVYDFSKKSQMRKRSNISPAIEYPNKFNLDFIREEDLDIPVEIKSYTAIKLNKDQIVTSKYYFNHTSHKRNLKWYKDNDILKIVYVNRYENGTPQIAYIKGVGLKSGAFASSIGHDSHNIVAVGVKDEDIAEVINEIIRNKGGLAVRYMKRTNSLSLPIAGIMSDKDAHYVANRYKFLTKKVQLAGSNLSSPFMTLAFMSLVVIPEIKIGERGLFDYEKFSFIE
ncbi:MAG: adenine deaminase [Culturomica sp.]|jgi:adenine deaminase|nr:adenine deaminase [Culturomica sp.]